MLTPDAIIDALERKGHVVFRGQDLDLNLVGLRVSPGMPNAFDDRLCAIWRQDGAWTMRAWSATTEPGTYWLQNPENVRGTAVLVPGQYRQAFGFGKHKGQYRCLVQVQPVKVWRDTDRDSTAEPGVIDEGFFGIHIHRANSARPSLRVDRWSAGCQVLADPGDFRELMALCDASAKTHGPVFSYTLMNWI